MVQKGAENSRNLTKVIKSARFFAKICRNLLNLNLNILLDWVVWGVLLLNFVFFLVEVEDCAAAGAADIPYF